MANQQRLAESQSLRGRPSWGAAARQCIIARYCNLRRCSRRMGLHYSGPHGSYPVYGCRADQDQHGGQRCQEVRALGVDAAVESWLLEALTPDRLALAMAALGELENEARALEHQWSLKRERARYEAERARRHEPLHLPEHSITPSPQPGCDDHVG
jgi:hypothetical protein